MFKPKKLMRLYQTVRHLKLVQFYARLWFKYSIPKPNLSPAPLLRELNISNWVMPAAREPSMVGPAEFKFLNKVGDLNELGWDSSNCEKLWNYNLHYFDDLNAVNANERSGWHKELIARWVLENQPAFGTAWEPYPLSIRIINWIKWSFAGNELPEDALQSLAVQGRWLEKRLEWHLLGNHLFMNAKALIFLGLFFEGAQAERWLKKGWSILKKQIPEQILPDGGQFELSTMYHCLAVEDMLDLFNICGLANKSSMQAHRPLVEKMLHWMCVMCHPDGEISFFNDAAIGIAPIPLRLLSYSENIGFSKQGVINDGVVHLVDSGYIRLQKGHMALLIDVAKIGPDYLPGHAHADCLSFELSIGESRVLVNSGTSTYQAGAQREFQRSTRAHNSLVIDDQNTSDIWSSFRVGERASVKVLNIEENDNSITVRASHDGYRKKSVEVIREWKLSADKLQVRDSVVGIDDCDRIKGYLKFHPDYSIEASDEKMVFNSKKDKQIKVYLTADFQKMNIENSHWYPNFGISIENKTIVFEPEENEFNFELSTKYIAKGVK